MGAGGVRYRAATALAAVCAVLLGLLTVMAAPQVRAAPASRSDDPVTLVLFHGEGCPHCAAEREWLTQLAASHPSLVVEEHEVWYDEANRDLLRA